MTGKTVIVKRTTRMEYKTEAVYQYDYGHELKLLGFDLPETWEMHFSGTPDGDSVTQLGTGDTVAVPDVYLTSGNTVYAWMYLHETEYDGETVFHIQIPIKRRARITNQTPTPVQQDVITQTISALNEAVGTVQGIAEGIDSQIDTALQNAKESGEFDGADGYSPTVNVTEITGGHRVAITDAQGTDTFDVMDGEKGDPGETPDISGKADKNNCVLTGSLSMGRGGNTGTNSTALGNGVKASGNYSFATGELCYAQSNNSFAEGFNTTASAESAHSEGNRSTASAFGAHSEGCGTVANNQGAHAQGRYNYNRPYNDMMDIYGEIADYGAFVANKKYYWNDGVVENDKLYRCTQYIKPAEFDPEDDEHWEEVPADFADVVGGGTVYERANIYALDWFGNIFIPGNVYVDCDDHSNPGTRLARETITRNISGTTPTINGKDNTRYLCGEVATISITPPATGMCEVRFTSGTTPAVLTLPNTVKMPDWFDATALEANAIYEMNFSDGYGVVTTWQA